MDCSGSSEDDIPYHYNGSSQSSSDSNKTIKARSSDELANRSALKFNNQMRYFIESTTDLINDKENCPQLTTFKDVQQIDSGINTINALEGSAEPNHRISLEAQLDVLQLSNELKKEKSKNRKLSRDLCVAQQIIETLESEKARHDNAFKDERDIYDQIHQEQLDEIHLLKEKLRQALQELSSTLTRNRVLEKDNDEKIQERRTILNICHSCVNEITHYTDEITNLHRKLSIDTHTTPCTVIVKNIILDLGQLLEKGKAYIDIAAYLENEIIHYQQFGCTNSLGLPELICNKFPQFINFTEYSRNEKYFESTRLNQVICTPSQEIRIKNNIDEKNICQLSRRLTKQNILAKLKHEIRRIACVYENIKTEAIEISKPIDLVTLREFNAKAENDLLEESLDRKEKRILIEITADQSKIKSKLCLDRLKLEFVDINIHLQAIKTAVCSFNQEWESLLSLIDIHYNEENKRNSKLFAVISESRLALEAQVSAYRLEIDQLKRANQMKVDPLKQELEKVKSKSRNNMKYVISRLEDIRKVAEENAIDNSTIKIESKTQRVGRHASVLSKDLQFKQRSNGHCRCALETLKIKAQTEILQNLVIAMSNKSKRSLRPSSLHNNTRRNISVVSKEVQTSLTMNDVEDRENQLSAIRSSIHKINQIMRQTKEQYVKAHNLRL
ncbi:hypothetical protein GJ496_003815 [Pomphorhynchus laevis]|nr:hypothetical protein GJ496_003815 [Pomphorhynchus laevis]